MPTELLYEERNEIQKNIKNIFNDFYEQPNCKICLSQPQGVGKSEGIIQHIKLKPNNITIIAVQTKEKMNILMKSLLNKGIKIKTHLSHEDILLSYIISAYNCSVKKAREMIANKTDFVISSRQAIEKYANKTLQQLLSDVKIDENINTYDTFLEQILSKVKTTNPTTSIDTEEKLMQILYMENILIQYAFIKEYVSYQDDKHIHLTTAQNFSKNHNNILKNIKKTFNVGIIFDEFNIQQFLTVDRITNANYYNKIFVDQLKHTINDIEIHDNELTQNKNADINGYYVMSSPYSHDARNTTKPIKIEINDIWNHKRLNYLILTSERIPELFFAEYGFNVIQNNYQFNVNYLHYIGINGFNKQSHNKKTSYRMTGNERYKSIASVITLDLNIHADYIITNCVEGYENHVNSKGSNDFVKKLNSENNPQNIGIMVAFPSPDKITDHKLLLLKRYHRMYHENEKYREKYTSFKQFMNSAIVNEDVKKKIILDEVEQAIGRFTGFRSICTDNVNEIFVILPNKLMNIMKDSHYKTINEHYYSKTTVDQMKKSYKPEHLDMLKYFYNPKNAMSIDLFPKFIKERMNDFNMYNELKILLQVDKFIYHCSKILHAKNNNEIKGCFGDDYASHDKFWKIFTTERKSKKKELANKIIEHILKFSMMFEFFHGIIKKIWHEVKQKIPALFYDIQIPVYNDILGFRQIMNKDFQNYENMNLIRYLMIKNDLISLNYCLNYLKTY